MPLFRTLNNCLSSTLSQLSLSLSTLALALTSRSRSHLSLSLSPLALAYRTRLSLLPLALLSLFYLEKLGVKLISKLLCGCALPRPPVSLRLPNSCVVVWITWICHAPISPTYLYLSSLFVFPLPLLTILLYGCLCRIFFYLQTFLQLYAYLLNIALPFHFTIHDHVSCGGVWLL